MYIVTVFQKETESVELVTFLVEFSNITVSQVRWILFAFDLAGNEL